MNRKLEEYKKKSNKIIKSIQILGILIFLLGVLTSIVQYVINKSEITQENQKASAESFNYNIDLEDNTIIYQDKIDINLSIADFSEENNYKVMIKMNDEIVLEKADISKQNTINIDLKNEGAKKLNVIIYKNEQEEFNKTLTIYYIQPYEKQFLDEITNKGINVHYGNKDSREDYKKSLVLLEKLGIKSIRTNILDFNVFKSDKYDFAYYDDLIEEVTNKNINILLTVSGFDYTINDDEKMNHYVEFIEKTIGRYSQIKNYEVLNKPNTANHVYYTDEELKYYAQLVQKSQEVAKKSNNKINIIAGVVDNAQNSGEKELSAKDFLDKITNNNSYSYANAYSYHPYNNSIEKLQESSMKDYLNNYKKWLNLYGGFIKNYATEYGNLDMTEELQAKKLLKQTVLMDKFGVDFSAIYDFGNEGAEKNNIDYNYGIVRNDYTPKLSYYSMKNYYTNTNGSEYIGYFNLQPGLETHVYNKNGAPLIITWSNDEDKDYDFQLNNMTAKDIYGKKINPDKDGKIKVTTTPIYLYNVDYKYFYKAISNTITTKYNEFTEGFKTEISKVKGLQSSINDLNQTIQSTENNSILSETTATIIMKKHYNLGNTLIQAYKSGTLQIEYVKLSSLLDALDDIGDSFEDLVTVSAATTDNVSLSETYKSITNAQKVIEDEDIQMIYPRKILELSQEFYETAKYINNQQEENAIKTGLIVSKNLHSQMLSNWGEEFAKLYIEKYISDNPVEINYSTTEQTNQDVTATLQTNANITVTNNENQKMHTFTQNGTFTFEYTTKGQSYTKTAKVTNIDKTAPTVTGVQNGKMYNKNVTPKVEDENLQEVILYKDADKVNSYEKNQEIEADGYYKLVATDKAKNQTTVEFYIARVPATITYSTTELTNQSVTATLTSNYEMTITNNSNSPTHTFAKNGEFTFEFEIKGISFELMAKVTNIDKTPPIIAGVENNKLYTESIKPQIQDENLQEITLYKDNMKVENYEQNQEIKEDGHYKLIAIDKAQNQTTAEFYIAKIPATIEYSTKDLTNKDVVATLKSNFEMKITNNSNNPTYMFKENGEYTFEFEIKGVPFKLTAKVDNIDKTPPKITGVKQSEQYVDKIKPIITDENLSDVTLYLNSYKVENYRINSEISGEGFYKILAKDKAGNETEIEFSIIELADKDYEYKETAIININNNTTKAEFDKKVKLSDKYSITRNGKKLSDTDKIATGDILQTTTGINYTLIVNGDINKDGDVNIKDVIKLRQYLLKRNNLDEQELLAADCNLDGKSISIKDLIRMRLIALERGIE